MNRTLLIFSFLIFSLFYGHSQGFNAGLQAGILGSQVDGDTYVGYNKPGLFAGGFVNRPLSSKLLLQLEINFIQKGSKDINNQTGFKYKLAMNYVEVPFFICYKYKYKIQVEAGLSFGYLINATESDNNGIVTGNPSFNKFELSWLGGMSYPLTQKLSVGIRYLYTAFFTPVRSNPTNNYYLYITKRGEYNNLVIFLLRYQLHSS